MILLLALAGGCAAQPAPGAEVAPPDRLQLEGVALAMDDGAELRAARASLDEQGRGTGEGVTAVVPGRPPLEIHAPVSDWDLKAHTAVFRGDVVATRGDVTLRASTLTVTFADGKVERAVAEPGVVVTQGARRAEAAHAELTAATGEIVLTGKPVLSEAGNRMAGDRITLWLDDERVRCEGCSLVVDGEALAPQ